MILLVVALVVSVPLFLSLGFWLGMRFMGRNLDRILGAMTPEELRVLARRTQARRVLADGESSTPDTPLFTE